MEETILVNISNINSIISESNNFKEIICSSYKQSTLESDVIFNNIEENKSILIPKKYYFTDFEELFKKDFLKKYFEEILNKLKYWGINPLPYEVVNFFVKNKENTINLDKYLLKYFYEINAIAQTVIKKENMCNNAVKINSVNLLKAAMENGYSVIKYVNINRLENDTYYYAVQYGSLQCIQYLKEICKIDMDYYYDDFEHYEKIYNIVAGKGYIDILTYLHNNKFGIEFAKQTFNEDELTDGALWSGKTVCVAAGNGHKHILEYFRENSSYRDPYPTYYAAANGQLECLIYLNVNGYHSDSTTCSSAARGGHVNILKYLHENGCTWTKDTCTEAARNGHIECLIYAHEHGCLMDRTAVLVATMKGHIECMKYIVEHIGDEWKTESITKFAVEYDNLNCFKYAIEKGCPWNKKECLKIAKGECNNYILAN